MLFLLKQNRIILLSLIICINGGLKAKLSEKDAAFIQKHALDKKLTAILDENKEHLASLIAPCNEKKCTIRHAVWNLPYLPGYLLKWGTSRIRGVEIMRSCIEEHKLTHITVPDKYFYHIPGRPLDLTSRNYVIVVPKLIEKKKHTPFTLDEIKQLCTLVKVTGYCDIQKPNIFRLENNKLAMIDTDAWAFNKKPYIGIMRFIHSYGEYTVSKDFTPEAVEYILYQLKELTPTNDKKIYKEFYDDIKKALKKRPASLKLFNELFSEPT